MAGNNDILQHFMHVIQSLMYVRNMFANTERFAALRYLLCRLIIGRLAMLLTKIGFLHSGQVNQTPTSTRAEKKSTPAPNAPSSSTLDLKRTATCTRATQR